VVALGAGKRPPVSITVNHHSWKSRVAIMRGRYLIGLSTANRRAAGVCTGDVIDVDIELDTTPRTVVEPPELSAALSLDRRARAAYDGLSLGRRRELVRTIDTAKRPETRTRRVAVAVAQLTETADD